MTRKDRDIIHEGMYHNLVFNQNLVRWPFAVISRDSGERVMSYASEQAGRAAVIHYDGQVHRVAIS